MSARSASSSVSAARHSVAPRTSGCVACWSSQCLHPLIPNVSGFARSPLVALCTAWSESCRVVVQVKAALPLVWERALEGLETLFLQVLPEPTSPRCLLHTARTCTAHTAHAPRAPHISHTPTHFTYTPLHMHPTPTLRPPPLPYAFHTPHAPHPTRTSHTRNDTLLM